MSESAKHNMGDAIDDSDLTDIGEIGDEYDNNDSDLTDIGELSGKESDFKSQKINHSQGNPEFSVDDKCLAPFSEDGLLYKASIVAIEKGITAGSHLATVKYDGYDTTCNEIHSMSLIKQVTFKGKKVESTSPAKLFFKKKDEFMRSLYASSSDDDVTPFQTKHKQNRTSQKLDSNTPLKCCLPSKLPQTRNDCTESIGENGDINSYDSGEKPCFDFPATGVKEPLFIMKNDDGEDVQVPATINQYLRDYQRDGVNFLYSHYNSEQGCILGDDMGLGKTIQIIAFLSAVFGKYGDSRDLFKTHYKPKSKYAGVVLIVSPASVLYNWLDELETWGHFKFAKFHGSTKKDALNKALESRVEILLTTYETLRNHLDELNEVKWIAAIMDEAHRIKGQGSSLTIASKELNVKCRIALSGTPLQNNMSELWCLLDWANPGCLGTCEGFDRKFSTPIKKGQRFDANKRELATARKLQRQLSVILGRMLLRRTKDLIQSQLPQKDERVVFCSMAPIQQAIYDQLLSSDEVCVIINKKRLCSCESGLKFIECCFKDKCENETVRGLTLKYLNLLMKTANHAALLLPRTNQTEDQKAKALDTCRNLFPIFPELKEMFNAPSLCALSDYRLCGKLKTMEKLLDVSHKNKDKVLLFSYSTQLLNILESYVISRGFSYLRLDGDTKTDQRSKLVSHFNTNSEIFLCLISTRAGSLGLNFTGANVVLLFDPMWNPSHDMQAQDRAYRIGQRRDVRVYRLIATNSIEENIYLRQVYKQQLSGLAVEGKSEKRLFNAVQGKQGRRGEVFGVEKLFMASSNGSLAQKLIERTENLEYGVKSSSYMLNHTVNCAKEDDDEIDDIYKVTEVAETDDDEQLSQIIDDVHTNLSQTNQETVKYKQSNIDTILDGCGVDFVHSNKSLLANSKREEHLSRKAIQEVFWDGLNSQDPANQSFNVTSSDDNDNNIDIAVESASKPSLSSSTESKRVFERRGNVMFLIGHVPPAIIQKQVQELAQLKGYQTINEFLDHLRLLSISEIAKLLHSFYLSKEPELGHIQSFTDAFNLNLSKDMPKLQTTRQFKKKRRSVVQKPRCQRRSKTLNPFVEASKRHLKRNKTYQSLFQSSSEDDNHIPKQGYKSFSKPRKLISSEEDVSDSDIESHEKDIKSNHRKKQLLLSRHTQVAPTKHDEKPFRIQEHLNLPVPFENTPMTPIPVSTLSDLSFPFKCHGSASNPRYISPLDKLLDDNYINSDDSVDSIDESYTKVLSQTKLCPSSPLKRKYTRSILDDLLNSEKDNEEDEIADFEEEVIETVTTTDLKQKKSILDDLI